MSNTGLQELLETTRDFRSLVFLLQLLRHNKVVTDIVVHLRIGLLVLFKAAQCHFTFKTFKSTDNIHFNYTQNFVMLHFLPFGSYDRRGGRE